MNTKQWNDTHKLCPSCKSQDILHSLVGVAEINGEYHDGINTANCKNCGWAGMVKDLIPPFDYVAPITGPSDAPSVKEETKTTEDGNMIMSVRTVDYEGHTYVCAKDIVLNIGEYGEQLLGHLKDQSAQEYTKQLLGEIIKMHIMADKMHWARKLEANTRQFEQEADAKSETETTDAE